MNATPTEFDLIVREEHLNAAIEAFRESICTDHPVGHAAWCVMAQAAKGINPNVRSMCNGMTLEDRTYVPATVSAAVNYRKVTSAFDCADFDGVRALLPLTIPMQVVR